MLIQMQVAQFFLNEENRMAFISLRRLTLFFLLAQQLCYFSFLFHMQDVFWDHYAEYVSKSGK